MFGAFYLRSSSHLRTPNSEWLAIAIRGSRFSLFGPSSSELWIPNGSQHLTVNTTSELSFRINLNHFFLCSLHRNRPSGLKLCTFHWSLISACCMLYVCECAQSLLAFVISRMLLWSSYFCEFVCMISLNTSSSKPEPPWSLNFSFRIDLSRSFDPLFSPSQSQPLDHG